MTVRLIVVGSGNGLRTGRIRLIGLMGNEKLAHVHVTLAKLFHIALLRIDQMNLHAEVSGGGWNPDRANFERAVRRNSDQLVIDRREGQADAQV